MLDREFTTRFLSFYLYGPEGYKPDLDTFMTYSMSSLNGKSEKERESILSAFDCSMRLAERIFGKWAFRKVFSTREKRKPINKALFEVWSVELAKLSPEERVAIAAKRKDVLQKFVKLMNSDKSFVDSVTSATGDRSRVNYRYSKIRALLKNILDNDN